MSQSEDRGGELSHSVQQSSESAPRARRKPQERSAQTRRKLLDAAIGLLHEQGFSRLTVNDVAHRAGLTAGAVQYHFRSSRDLIHGVINAVFPILRVSLDQIAKPEQPLPARIGRLVDLYWELYRRPEYLVFWEIVFGARDKADVRAFLHSLVVKNMQGASADLARAFSDVPLRPQAAMKLWTFISSQLRGLALLSIFKDKNIKADLAILKNSAYRVFVELTEQSI